MRGASLHCEGPSFSEALNSSTLNLGFRVSYWLQTQLFNFWGSYKVVDSESFNFYFLGFWASLKDQMILKSRGALPIYYDHESLYGI